MRTLVVCAMVVIAVASLASGIFGLLGKGGAANVANAVPTLLTGIMCGLTLLAHLKRTEWYGSVGALSVAGHLVSHALLLLRGPGATMSGERIVGLFFVPALWTSLVITLPRLKTRASAD